MVNEHRIQNSQDEMILMNTDVEPDLYTYIDNLQTNVHRRFQCPFSNYIYEYEA